MNNRRRNVSVIAALWTSVPMFIGFLLIINIPGHNPQSTSFSQLLWSYYQISFIVNDGFFSDILHIFYHNLLAITLFLISSVFTAGLSIAFSSFLTGIVFGLSWIGHPSLGTFIIICVEGISTFVVSYAGVTVFWNVLIFKHVKVRPSILILIFGATIIALFASAWLETVMLLHTR